MTIPNPPLIFLSKRRIGGGFTISKRRKRKNPITIFVTVGVRSAIVHKKPTTSSITMEGGSCRPKMISPRWDTYQARAVRAEMVRRYTGQLKVEKAR